MRVEKLKRGYYKVEVNGINHYIEHKIIKRVVNHALKSRKVWVLTNDKNDFDYDEFGSKAEAITFLELKYKE